MGRSRPADRHPPSPGPAPDRSGSSTDAHWDAVWNERDPDEVSWAQPSADDALATIRELVPDRSAPIVDVGGGTSPLAGQLLAAGYLDVTVADISAAALERHRVRLGERAADVRWLVADVLAFPTDRSYAVWHDRAVLHFLTDPDEQRRYAERLAAAVRPEGYALIATFGPDGPSSCSGLPVQRYDRDAMTDLLAGAFVPVELRDEDHTTPSGVVQRFLSGVFRRT